MILNILGKVSLKKLYEIIYVSGVWEGFGKNFRKKILLPNCTTLTINFSNKTFFEDIHSLVALAIFIRHIANNGLSVIINLPQKGKAENSILHFLNETGFNDLFTNHYSKQVWMDKIKVENYFPTPRKKYRPKFELYLPFRWIDNKSFVYDRNIEIERVRPTIEVETQNFYMEHLVGKRFLSLDETEVFLRNLFLELGWNIVLHSDKKLGKGFGIAGGKVFKDEKTQSSSLQFCFADAGKGIPYTILCNYRKNDKNYHIGTSYGEKSALIRWALEDQATSREKFPSETDEHSYRGLTLVSHTIASRGDLQIISDGGHLILKKNGKLIDIKPTNTYGNFPFIGTQVLFNLISAPIEKFENFQLRDLNNLDFQIIGLYDTNDINPLSDFDLSSKYIDSISATSDIIIFDIGFKDQSFRNLEYLIEHAIAKLNKHLIIFWNVNSTIEELQIWMKYSKLFRGTYPFKVVITKSENENYLISNGKTPNLVPRLNALFKVIEEKEDLNFPYLKSFELKPLLYNDINSRINTNYITQGFNLKNISEGFFEGQIHLLSGKKSPYYFAINKNIAGKNLHNLKRWHNSALSKILEITSDIKEKIIIFTFSSSIKEIAKRLRLELGDNFEIYILLSYDTPNLEDIEVVIKEYRYILLLTDVISSGSHMMGIIETIQKTKVFDESSINLLGVLTLVNAIDSKYQNETFQHSLSDLELKLYNCSKLQYETINKSITNEEYWIDPISKLPGNKSNFRSKLDKRIDQSIDFLTYTQSTYIGHVIDSSRHSSVWFDLNCLLESKKRLKFVSHLFELIDQRLKAFEWEGFNPEIILFPSGSGYLIKITNSDDQIDSFSHYEITIKNIEKILNKKYRIKQKIEVGRTFDTFGHSVISKVIDTSSLPNVNLKDIIIIDDGISSGRTSKSLIQLGRLLGAERILIIPFIARLNLRDIIFWENIKEIASINSDTNFYDEKEEMLVQNQSLFNNTHLKVCYVFPLIVPLTYYQHGECPYEITTLRLSKKTDKNYIISQISASLIEDLAGHTISSIVHKDVNYSRFWLTIRTYSEMALDNDEALEALYTLIETSVDYDKLSIIFKIFLEEWVLIRRSRLRQTLGELLKKKAMHFILNKNVIALAKLIPISFLRSQFTDTFIMHLKEITNEITQERETNNEIEKNGILNDYLFVVERILHHIFTLTNKFKNNASVKYSIQVVLDSLIKKYDFNLPIDKEKKVQELSILCRAMLLENYRTSNQTSKIDTLKYIYSLITDGVLNHKCWHIVEALINQIQSFGPITFNNYYNYFANEFKELINVELIGIVISLKEFLIVSSLDKGNLPDPKVEYLYCENKNEPGDDQKTLQQDYIELIQGLQFLATSLKNAGGTNWSKEVCSRAAQRIYQSVGGIDSTLAKHINKLHSISIQDFIYLFQDEVKRFLKTEYNNINFSLIDHTTFSLEIDRLFIPPYLMEKAILRIVSNLKSKAYKNLPSNYEIKLEFVLYTDQSKTGNKRLIVDILNNGNQLTKGDQKRKSPNTLELIYQLEYFNSFYSGPSISNDAYHKYVTHTLFFEIW